MIYFIVIFDLFQQSQTIAPFGFPDLARCNAVLEEVQPEFDWGFYGRCLSTAELERLFAPIHIPPPQQR